MNAFKKYFVIPETVYRQLTGNVRTSNIPTKSKIIQEINRSSNRKEKPIIKNPTESPPEPVVSYHDSNSHYSENDDYYEPEVTENEVEKKDTVTLRYPSDSEIAINKLAEDGYLTIKDGFIYNLGSKTKGTIISLARFLDDNSKKFTYGKNQAQQCLLDAIVKANIDYSFIKNDSVRHYISMQTSKKSTPARFKRKSKYQTPQSSLKKDSYSKNIDWLEYGKSS